MNRRKISIYFLVPLALTVPMILMYFSGNETLQHIISPDIEGIYGNSNRELGLLESLENVLLIAILVVLVRGFIYFKRRGQRAVIAVLAALSSFVLLEETDYGRHYYEYFGGIQAQDAATDRNWHNNGERTNRTKQVVDTGMVIWFALAPFALAGSAFPAVRLVTPDKYAALGLIAMYAVRTLAHELQNAGFGDPGTMDSNLSEFRELLTYYLCAVYLFDVLERRARAKPGIGSR